VGVDVRCKVSIIAVLPVDGDPARLLERGGPCDVPGLRKRGGTYGHVVWWDQEPGDSVVASAWPAEPPVLITDDGRRTLPLWIDGVVPEAWDRLRRCFYAWPGREGQPCPQVDLVAAVRNGPGTSPPLEFVAWVAELATQVGMVSEVLELARHQRDDGRNYFARIEP
jgi:hypothetical protein